MIKQIFDNTPKTSNLTHPPWIRSWSYIHALSEYSVQGTTSKNIRVKHSLRGVTIVTLSSVSFKNVLNNLKDLSENLTSCRYCCRSFGSREKRAKSRYISKGQWRRYYPNEKVNPGFPPRPPWGNPPLKNCWWGPPPPPKKVWNICVGSTSEKWWL